MGEIRGNYDFFEFYVKNVFIFVGIFIFIVFIWYIVKEIWKIIIKF